jgi:hypothetical protein
VWSSASPTTMAVTMNQIAAQREAKEAPGGG